MERAKKCDEHSLAVAWRDAPLRVAPVVIEGNLRSRLAPARKGFVEKPDSRAIFVRSQDLQAPQRVSTPSPIGDGLETTGGLVIGITAPAGQSRLQRRGRLVVDVFSALDARADRFGQYLCEALHLGSSVGRINEAGVSDD